MFPAAIEYHTLIGASPRDDGQVQVIALDWDAQTDCFDTSTRPSHHPIQQWSNYVRGVADQLLLRGHSLSGCNLAITGNVPQGAGLSSSAALEVGIARALAEVSGIALDNLALAQVGQDAENQFAGCACGIMDQLISAAGIAGHAVAIDCRDLSLTPVHLPESLSILMVNSNVKRGLVDSEYNTRRAQCEAAAQHFKVASLRDVSLDTFRAHSSELDPVVAKRAQHILEENQRVLAAMQALRDNNMPRLSELMAQSHQSMRDLFEITTPEVDTLVDILAAVLGQRGGVRMTGGGFGGCVVALLETALVEPSIKAVNAQYRSLTGLDASFYQSRPVDGVSLLPGPFAKPARN